MRASSNDIHVSGSERILNEACLEKVFEEVICKALSSYNHPEKILINVDTVEPESIEYIQALDIRTITPSSYADAEKTAKEILKSTGISHAVINAAFSLLRNGATPEGHNMRGAIIMDIVTGNRIEPDLRRGVRVSRIDYAEEARHNLKKELQRYGIFHDRVTDAVAIASKVCSRKETVAELCWSDNPEYTTGYVASEKTGYVRITNMKETGSTKGGRVFFVNPEALSLNDYIHYLERQPVIIKNAGQVYAP
ncbi:MAG: 6-carboxyhexanoate--CoA ligase [Nitrospira sp.]|nr:6-carboxyhexanoate--CoA ligase [Nitrospira sp.]